MYPQKIVALTCTLLIVLSAFTAGVVLGGSTPGNAASTQASASTLAQVGNQAPATQKQFAIGYVGELSTETNVAEHRKQQTLDLLEGTLPAYRDDTRVDRERVFHDDAKALQALADLAGTGQDESVDSASALVVEADHDTAAQAIADAERALDRAEPLQPRGQQRSTERAITNAKKALERGDAERQDAREQPTMKRVVQTRANALKQYATAWRHAQRAIDTIDRNQRPTVAIHTRADPPRNGTETTTYRVVGDVVDPQAYELDNATVTVNGQDRIVPLTTSTAPATNATFDFEVTLTDRVTTIEVTVTDVPVAPDDEEGGDAQTGQDTVRLDGDGLPDTYETEVFGTDPLDHDSDVDRTDANESGDDVPDGLEDPDSDSVVTYEEYVFGTDPFSADTDGDGIADRVELTYQQVDPADSDTDDDGTPDGEADPDDDSLTTSAEVAFGSNPFRADTDTDELRDADERDIGTDPVATDTDNDTLADGVEVRLGTDPLVADTDGDGTPDGEEQFTTTAANDDLGTRIDVTGVGDVAAGISIASETGTAFQSDAIEAARASPVVSLESERAFDRAEVTIGYDAAAAGNESNLAIYTFDEELRTFVRLNSTVDAANDTVTTTTTHFSRFVVFNVKNWDEQFTASVPEAGGDPTQPGTIAVDTIFVLDSSGSMGGNDPNDLRQVGAKRFVGALIEGDRAGVVDFDSYGSLTQPLTTDFDAANASIDAIDSSGGTNIGAGLNTANNEFDSSSNSSRAKITILLSDGYTSYRSSAQAAAEAAADRNITIYTIGFGNPDDALMQGIADTTGGTYTFVNDVNDLPDVFSRIAENVTGPNDTDGDGLSDAREIAGLPTGRSGTLYTDPYDADTDNDGVPDGEEAGTFVNVTESGDAIVNGGNLPSGLSIPGGSTVDHDYYRLVSNPVVADTDGDGLSDGEELTESRPVRFTNDPDATRAALEAKQTGNDPLVHFEQPTDVYSDPFWADIDGDGFDDGEETRQFTNPNWFDTDGDGIADDEERAAGEDPTLFDASPPTVEILAISATAIGDVDGELTDVFDARYTIRYRVSDPSGVDHVRVFKAGEQGVERFADVGQIKDGYMTDSFVAQSYATFLAETVLGPQVQVEATDVHGNDDTVAQRAPNAFAKAAKFVDDLGGDALLPARLQRLGVVGFLAALSGFTYYIGSSVDQVVGGVEFAIDILRGKVDVDLAQLADAMAYLINNPEVLKQMPGAMAKTALRAQNLQNPFPDADLDDVLDPFSATASNVTFAYGWFLGGLLGIAAEAVLTAGIGSYAKAVGKGIPVVARVIRAGETASSLVSGALGVGKQAALISGRTLARGTGLALDALTDTLGRLSVAKQFVVSSRVVDLDPGVRDLARAEGLDRGLVAALDVGDNAAVRMLNDLDDGTRKRLLRVADCRVGGATASLAAPIGGAGFVGTSDAYSVGTTQIDALGTAGGCAGFPDEESFRKGFKNVYEAYDSGDLSKADVDRLSRRLADDDSTVVARTLADGGDNGAQLIAKTNHLDAVKRLANANDVGDEAFYLIRGFDDPEVLEEFFALDVSRADEVRRNLARFSPDRHFSPSKAEQFVKDARVVKDVPGFDTPIQPGGRTTIDDMADAGDAGNLKGYQREVRIAASRIDEGRSVKYIGRQVDDVNGEEATDIDVELEDEIIESKSTMTEENAKEKLESYEDAAIAGNLDLNGKTVTFDSDNQVSDSVKSAIRQRARDIEARNNGIDSIIVKFENTPPVEVDSG